MRNIIMYDQFDQLIESTSNNQVNTKLLHAASLIQRFVSKKLKIPMSLIPLVSIYDGVPSILLVSGKNESAIRIAGPVSGVPGIVGQIDFFEKHWESNASISLSSESFPIVQLLHEFVRLVGEPKYASSVLESASLNEGQKYVLSTDDKKKIDKLLSTGTSVLQIHKRLGIPYGAIARFKRNINIVEDESPLVVKNEETLTDKTKFLEETMADVYNMTRAIGAGAFNSMMISGRAGTGKTYNVTRALEDEGLVEGTDYVKVSGAVSVVMMYKELYNYRTKVIVFDDADGAIQNDTGRNILKAALDTKKVRTISYLKKLPKLLYDPKEFDNNPQGEYDAIENGLVPNRFDFEGRIIFISNLSKDKADPDGAIRSRSILVDINPDDATLMERMKILLPYLDPTDMHISEKEEIFAFMQNAKDVSMRTFVKAAGFKMAKLPNWERMAKRYI